MQDFDDVYEPSDDSYLFGDALEAESDRIASLPPPTLALEIGPGSGVMCTLLMRLLRSRTPARVETTVGAHGVSPLPIPSAASTSPSVGGGSGGGSPPCVLLACDVNARACAATLRTAAANGVDDAIEAIQCDLVGPLMKRVAGLVDILLFNPPYVPTPSEEVPRPCLPASMSPSVSAGGALIAAAARLAAAGGSGFPLEGAGVLSGGAAAPRDDFPSKRGSACGNGAAELLNSTAAGAESDDVLAVAAPLAPALTASASVATSFLKPFSSFAVSLPMRKLSNPAVPLLPCPAPALRDASSHTAAAAAADASFSFGPIAAAWAGGVDGREVIDRFLPQLPQLLSRPHGTAYMILVEENCPADVASRLRESWGLKCEVIASRRARNELLHVARISWAT